MSETVKFMYLRDPKNPKRVITVARQLTEDGKFVKVGWAVCRPTVREGKYIVSNGDEFNKKRGREIAVGRLKKNGGCLRISVEGKKPVVAIINALLEVEGIVGKVTLGHVTKRLQERKERGECAS